MTPETPSESTVPSAAGELAPAQAAAVDVSRIDQGIRDQIAAELGTRTPPGRRRVHVERAWLLREYLDDLTFAVVLHWLSSGKRQSLDTKRGYADDLIRVALWLRERDGTDTAHLLTQLTSVTVTNWVMWAKNQGMAVRTQRRVLSALSSLFTYAARKGLPVANPVDFEEHALPVGTSTTGRPAGATKVLKLDQLAAIRDACQTDEEHLVFSLLCVQGFRESEVVNMLVENIDRDEDPPIVQAARKRGLWVRRRLDPDTVVHLDAHLDGRITGPLLLHTDEDGSPVPANRHYVINLTRRLARRAAVPSPSKVTPHVLRACAITSLLDDGKPLQEVQKWAGHAHATTTQGYWERENAVERDAALSASLTAKLDAATAGINSGADR